MMRCFTANQRCPDMQFEMQHMEEKNKSFIVGAPVATVGDLKRVLESFDEKSRYVMRIEALEPRQEDYRVSALTRLCLDMYQCLSCCRSCVESLAGKEKKTGSCTIYYDREAGYNTGATGLLKSIDKVLDKYHETLVKVDLTV